MHYSPFPHFNTDTAVCPWCGHQNPNSHELETTHDTIPTTTCTQCEKTYSYKIHHTKTTYSTWKGNK